MEEIQELKRLLALPSITDLVIDGAHLARADFGNGLVPIENPFRDAKTLSTALSQLALSAGSRLDIAKPIADFSLFGSRFHAVLAQGVSEIPLVSIRKHIAAEITVDHLVETGMVSAWQGHWLKAQVENRSSILISGATSSGKTTLLRALLAGLDERVIAIEQTPELMLLPPAISLTERASNQEGVGAISLDELVVHALRMRPDRIVVGEVRSKEFQVLLQAINNGHTGTMATLHASSLSQVAERALILGMLAGMSAALTSRLFANSVDLVIQLKKVGNQRLLHEIGRPQLRGDELSIEKLSIEKPGIS